MNGIFLTIEGIEGAGKSTQTARLAGALRAAGHTTLVTREPGGGGLLGERLRELLKDPRIWRDLGLAEIYLYGAARCHHLETTVLPALSCGEIVLCDRYLDSTRAYQGAGRGRPLELIERLHALPPLDVQPDRTVLLDLPVEDGLQRARARQNVDSAGYDDEDHAFFARVREGFLAIARREPGRVRVVAAAGEVDEVHREICHALRDLFPRLAPITVTS